MNTGLFRKIVDNENPKSLANKMRRKRFVLFKSLLEALPKPLHILDAGGTASFWSMMGWTSDEDIQIVLLNLREIQVSDQKFKSIVGDIKDMSTVKDQEFDVVFSNSVLQYAWNFSEQQRMADEIQRVGKRYFLQTPNRYFPLEPHFLFPFFQFLPLSMKVWLLMHCDLGSHSRVSDRQKAIEIVSTRRLLTKREMHFLFPNATLVEEKFLGLAKSFIVYEGW